MVVEDNSDPNNPSQKREVQQNAQTATTRGDVTSKNDEAIKSEWKKKREARRRHQHNGESTIQSSGRNDNVTAENEEQALVSMMFEKDVEDGGSNNNLTAAKRRKLEQESVLLADGKAFGSGGAGRRKQLFQSILHSDNKEQRISQHETEGRENDGKGQPDNHEDVDDGSARQDDNDDNAEVADSKKVESLLDSVAALHKKNMTIEERAALSRQEEEARILREASKVIQTNALQAAHDVAQGVIYQNPMMTTWRPPKYIMEQGERSWQATRDEWHMQVQGDNIPPPIKRFIDLKFPKPVLECLQSKNIKKPTPIQIQGLPVALACRDMVGIAFTGSGKTLTFTLPLVMVALEEELRMPIIANEGPIGIVLAPSRELARQTYDVLADFCKAISSEPGYPELRCQLLIGGESLHEQLAIAKSRGIHCVVATPGRLRDVLKRKAINLSICRYICLDEADRMLDMGFDEEVSEIMNYFTNQRQTLLFSATFPRKFQDFARQTLVKPIVVNVGRAGAANLDVIQEVEYVKDESKIVYLLHCLQKTAPPVIIFCERKGSADDIHEYLLLKGVEAVSIHGGKDQEERNEAIRLFKEGKKDVLIATDIAAKGLDFPAIQHVINFDMPSEIENYVHRIGRTGRAGKTGVATTFINKSCDETTLLDLKGLLKEAKQRIPPVLMMLEDPREKNGGLGCSFCGGLGHTIVDCPKIDKDARRVAAGHKDLLAGRGGDW